jgi:hypothetical protein
VKINDSLPGKAGVPGRAAEDNRLFIVAVCWIARTRPQNVISNASPRPRHPPKIAEVGNQLLSNYDCDLLIELYPAKKWRKLKSPPRTNHSTKGKRTEVLWTNYDPSEVESINGRLF